MQGLKEGNDKKVREEEENNKRSEARGSLHQSPAKINMSINTSRQAKPQQRNYRKTWIEYWGS